MFIGLTLKEIKYRKHPSDPVFSTRAVSFVTTSPPLHLPDLALLHRGALKHKDLHLSPAGRKSVQRRRKQTDPFSAQTVM